MIYKHYWFERFIRRFFPRHYTKKYLKKYPECYKETDLDSLEDSKDIEFLIDIIHMIDFPSIKTERDLRAIREAIKKKEKKKRKKLND